MTLYRRSVLRKQDRDRKIANMFDEIRWRLHFICASTKYNDSNLSLEKDGTSTGQELTHKVLMLLQNLRVFGLVLM
jgi:hypothetical protein